MTSYIVTGGTGFLGSRVIPRLLAEDPSAVVHVLVRRASLAKLERRADGWTGGERVRPLLGDLVAPGLALEGDPPPATSVIHLGAVYDMTAPAEQTIAANVTGTRSVIELARRLGATLHHVSSIAVAGDHVGPFTEDDFDLGQGLPSPYHESKFAAEKLVREAEGLRWRVYRPAVVVGDSTTGEMDKIDGPYYFFTGIAMLARLPHALPVPVPDLGSTNVVPVDYVADALVDLALRPGLDGRTFHLVNPRPQRIKEIYGALADAAGAPRALGSIPRSLTRRAVTASEAPRPRVARRLVLGQLGIPDEVVDHLPLPTVFSAKRTEAELASSGIRVPPFASYAGRLWTYWAANLDPTRARRNDPAGVLVGRRVVITGASSGIGRAAALAAAERGARVLLLARSAAKLDEVVAEIRAAGGDAHAYACDVTDQESVDATIKAILTEHDHVDHLVNNAGRSIRRSVSASTSRMHDYERTMAVNYFGAVRMVLAVLPGMKERRFGHIVNVSSFAVIVGAPRFSAYAASKSALDTFSDCTAVETLSSGITFTNIHMPLVRTPMIAPTTAYQRMPAVAPEAAAAMVVRALEHRPPRIDTPLGTLAELGNFFTPKFKRLVVHQEYRLFPDSRAARDSGSTDGPAARDSGSTDGPAVRDSGSTDGTAVRDSGSTDGTAVRDSGSTDGPAASDRARPRLRPSQRWALRGARGLKRAGSHLPGVYW